METKYITISKDENDKVQYLSELLGEIPTNTIFHKFLTGLGATYSEIKAKRNSIIVEPNLPVIEGKCENLKHQDDNLFGVMESVTVENIKNYLEQTLQSEKYINILTTPESFNKIRKAFEICKIDMYNDCFLLFDECHKLIKDVDYRQDIISPIDDFFKFKNKALVSATITEFSDPRFNNFQLLKIKPTFEYRRKIFLKITNNVLQAVKDVLKETENDLPNFFFINSVDIIYSLMNKLGITEESAVFCASSSVKVLRDKGFKNVFSKWNAENMSKYNFFTSRFFNAFDIELDIKPKVIIISDVLLSPYTMIDPRIDTVQIVGRFRNGISYSTHITNIDNTIRQWSNYQINMTLKTWEGVYNNIKRFRDVVTIDIVKEALESNLKLLPFAKMIDKNGCKNYFALDNYKEEKFVKNSYYDIPSFIEAYKSSAIFNPIYKELKYSINDKDVLTLENKTDTMKAKRKQMVELLDTVKDCTDELSLEFIQSIRQTDALTVDAFQILGKKRIEELNYAPAKMKMELIKHQFENSRKGTEVVEAIKTAFQVGEKYTYEKIKKQLSAIFDQFGIVPPPDTKLVSCINYYFKADEVRIGKKGTRGLILLEER